MNNIIEIDKDNMVCVTEPGVTTAVLQESVQKEGLFYGGDPAGGDSCFIGGNVATNAGGNRAVKYGVTRDQVMGMEVVTPSGEVVTLGGKFRKNATGYMLMHLFIGSEGTSASSPRFTSNWLLFRNTRWTSWLYSTTSTTLSL